MKKYINFIKESEENQKQESSEAKEKSPIGLLLSKDIKLEIKDAGKNNPEKEGRKEEIIENIKKEKDEAKRKKNLRNLRMIFGKNVANDLSKELKLNYYFR